LIASLDFIRAEAQVSLARKASGSLVVFELRSLPPTHIHLWCIVGNYGLGSAFGGNRKIEVLVELTKKSLLQIAPEDLLLKFIHQIKNG
jgi:hypothetical protein